MPVREREGEKERFLVSQQKSNSETERENENEYRITGVFCSVHVEIFANLSQKYVHVNYAI